MIDLSVAPFQTDCFYRIGGYFVLLHTPCNMPVHVQPDPNLQLGWVRVNTLHLGEGGMQVGYAIEATGKVKMGTYFLMAARKSVAARPIKDLERMKDYPELKYKPVGLKVLTTPGTVLLLSTRPLDITDHLDNP